MTVSNIAAGTPPPSAMETMGNMVNIARGVQSYQTGQIDQQARAIDLQSQQQANEERKAVVAAMQNKDPDLQAGPDGIIDQSKSIAKLQQLAPQTWMQYAGAINKNNSDATTVNNQILGLNQQQIQDVGKFFASKVGRPVSEIVSDAQAFKEANPALSKQVDLALKAYDGAGPSTQESIDARTMHIATRAETLAAQKEVVGQSYGTVDRGSQKDLFQTNKFAPGGVTTPDKPSYTVGAGVAPAIIPNALGQPTLQAGMAGAPATTPGSVQPAAPVKPQTSAPTTGAPSKVSSKTVEPPPVPAFMDKPTADNITAYNTKWREAANANADPNTGYQAQTQIYKNLFDILKKNPNVGPGSAGLNQMQKYLTPFGASTSGATGYQETLGYLDRLSQANAGRANATTNFAKEQSSNATGTPDFNNTALTEKLRYGASTNEAGNAYTQAVQKFQQNYGTRAAAAGPQFESSWANNADPIAFRLMSAKNIGDTEDYKATLKKASPLVLHHYENLQLLLAGKIPKE